MQAMIPRAVKDRLKPWQVEGLRHLFTTIILDHDSDLWRKHRQETAAARLSQDAAGAAVDTDDVPLHAGGAILAQVRVCIMRYYQASVHTPLQAPAALHTHALCSVPAFTTPSRARQSGSAT